MTDRPMPMETQSPHSPRFAFGLNHEVWHFSELVLRSRFAQALEEGIGRYPIHRSLRFAARLSLENLFDDLALNLGWRAQRLDAHSMILDQDGLFISAFGVRKADYCSCIFEIWASSPETAEQAKTAILDKVGEARIREPMFSIDWHFLTSKGDLESAGIEEMADDVLLDEAYPEISGGVHHFIADYLAARETVLVLQGPPGTGKTRLIRAILGEISRQKGGKAQALYTGDKKALESDEIFVKFLTGWEDAFVIEDADHILKPRSQGNENLHRFLAIADGVVRSQGRKIIFSTNLPNMGDLDDSLIRPGRCFSRLWVRDLKPKEADKVLKRLCSDDSDRLERARERLGAPVRKGFSLAEIYKAAENEEKKTER